MNYDLVVVEFPIISRETQLLTSLFILKAADYHVLVFISCFVQFQCSVF